jgi:dTDP-4-amino-4,6-dideoxygalactose transaminase
MATVGPRILLIGGTYRALCVLERLLERGERVVAFLGEEGSGEHNFCPEILEVCDRAGVPARSARKLGEEIVRWLDDRIRPDLAVSVGLRGDLPVSIGGNCRLGLLDVSAVHDGGPRPQVVLRHQGREVARRELDIPKEDERAGQLFVRVTEEILDLLEQHLEQLGRAHARPQLRVPFESPRISRRELERAARDSRPGARTELLEAQLAAQTGAARALALESTAEAGALLCRALGIGRGDSVLASALASESLVRGLRQSGARVTLADVDLETLTLDPTSVRERLSGDTRAIVVSHSLGVSARTDDLTDLAHAANLPLIEDCGAALGGRSASGMLGGRVNPCVFDLSTLVGGSGPAPALVTLPEPFPEQILALAQRTRLGDAAAELVRMALQSQDSDIAARERNARFYSEELWRYDAFTLFANRTGAIANHACYPLGVTHAARICAQDLHRLLHEVGIEVRLLPALGSERALCETPRAEQARETTVLLPIHAELTTGLRDAVLDALYDYAIG